MAATMNMDLEATQFLACIECGKVVMRKQTHIMKKKKKDTLMGSSDSNEHELMVTVYYACDQTDKIRGAFDHKGLIFNINKRMIETWYVYLTLRKLVNKIIRVKNYGNGTVQLINKGKFIHNGNNMYELTTINIHPDNPEGAIAVMCQHLVSGFF